MGDVRDRLARYYPQMGVRVTTPRVLLQMPLDEDLLTLLGVIAEGIHDPAEMPFMIPWTDTPSPRRDRESLSHWWGLRAAWSPTNWNWNAAVYILEKVRGELVPVQNVVLDREAWQRIRRDDISIEGLDACPELFGST